ncbi:PLP-dependent aminotransferase family protein [Flagellimonas nanhaiensis]|uniref:PLP-dependent aminotransferase family protein n=1 Tax=Flagellimonas nanhaiensis TaxID=2292706 RepID=A0A371JQF4_9FLAO|nr:PLP-dependent aminotransferase family protein [Allomuricauda nanhaiensis]RDY59706.1 PLP-dependent aminotransferase family protein [Allomuricauda nanhaiensis]
MKNKLNSLLFSNGFNYQKDGHSIYVKLSNSIAKAIIEKKLVKGYKLPPTRILAKDLNLSRSTVIKAYEILCDEKYISSRQGAGYFVSKTNTKKFKYRIGSNTELSTSTLPDISERAHQFGKYVNAMNRGGHKGIAFRPGLPPLDIFPVRQWQGLTNNYWKDVTFSDLSYRDTLGLDSLRKNIVTYLKIYRNIQCDYKQVVIVTGSLHSLAILGDLLLDENDQVIVENPTYANAIALFKSLRAKIVPAEIDAEGLSVKSIKSSKLKRPKLIYTTPSNQYPTGVQMSLNRRLEILEWAREKNALIIEDDYDHEFSNWNKPISSIFGLDKGNSVIYLGTFNKLLHPSIRLGYLIVPHHYVDPIKAMYEQSLRFVSPVIQKVMSDFIEKDYLSQHLRKVVRESNERRAFFVRYFKELFGDKVQLHSLHSGLHLIAKLPDHVDDVEVSNFLGENEIVSFPYSKYFIKGKKGNGLVMGFSSVSQPVIKQKLEKMARLMSTII